MGRARHAPAAGWHRRVIAVGAFAALGVLALAIIAMGGGRPGAVEPDAAPVATRTAAPEPAAAVPVAGPAAMPEQAIRAAANEPGMALRGLRAVDAAHGIVCGERTVTGGAWFRRFVWIGETRTLVTDDGGADFALLVRICDPRRAPT